MPEAHTAVVTSAYTLDRGLLRLREPLVCEHPHGYPNRIMSRLRPPDMIPFVPAKKKMAVHYSASSPAPPRLDSYPPGPGSLQLAAMAPRYNRREKPPR